MELRLYNTLTRTKEIFRPIEPGKVRLYTCGPTVYRFIHIGNLRSFMLADWMRRTLIHFGYEVKHVKNITDVGHMRQELLDRGEDKMIAAARKEGKTPLEIAAFYTQAFMDDEAQGQHPARARFSPRHRSRAGDDRHHAAAHRQPIGLRSRRHDLLRCVGVSELRAFVAQRIGRLARRCARRGGNGQAGRRRFRACGKRPSRAA